MKWIRERDALIAQTLAFVQSVTGWTGDPRAPDAPAPMPDSAETTSVRPIEIASEVEAPPAIPPPQPFQVASPRTGGDLRSEMQDRIANFRRHQERFEREREEYCTATLTKLRAAIRDVSPRPPSGK
ncbi:hypothetical protein AYJ54_20070 [Bradyrhizobium centrolobii]|uniref:Uncharacterized protein n=1 Tax=Bradyrhizobium centrolobii TaxID=1505087 RepID=A0A176YH77_9BRAD|nr:hypothetical protein [Bradyrhizobium centrolobii]OAF05995.1 hypothetical protein AYJ54_20070 [Bradyrhizobium centrolobii]